MAVIASPPDRTGKEARRSNLMTLVPLLKLITALRFQQQKGDSKSISPPF